MIQDIKRHYWIIRNGILSGGYLSYIINAFSGFLKSAISIVIRVYVSNKSVNYHGECGKQNNKPKVLIVGVALSSKKNTAAHLIKAFGSSRCFSVTQRWATIGSKEFLRSTPNAVMLRIEDFIPKFSLINTLLADSNWQEYDFIIVSDDDIIVPKGFLDSYLSLQLKYDFSLAQPARTRNSHTDHKFVLQDKHAQARRTRFVEIGPLFSIRKDLARSMLPFDETSPMGWGCDYIWPVIVESFGLKMGIIDCVAVDHSLRPQGKAYSRKQAHIAEANILSKHAHLTDDEPFKVFEIYFK